MFHLSSILDNNRIDYFNHILINEYQKLNLSIYYNDVGLQKRN